MLDAAFQLPISLALFQDGGIFHAPSGDELLRIIFRFVHFVAGITWIGMLYFFNLVNVNFMKALDGPTKKVVVPELMPRALWYFRWGALLTVFAGISYYAMYMLAPDTKNQRAAGGDASILLVFLGWLAIAILFWVVYFFLLPRLTKDGRILGVVTAVLMVLMSVLIVWCLNDQLEHRNNFFASNKTLSIGIGGALGIIMLFNVWGIIWPAQKRIIAGTVSGEAAPPELARRAFLASRTNAWLSLPMLFFMATSHGDWVILGR